MRREIGTTQRDSMGLVCGGTRPSRRRSLPLLLSPDIAFDGIRPHGHRTGVHLLLPISPLEPPSYLLLSEFAPSASKQERADIKRSAGAAAKMDE